MLSIHKWSLGGLFLLLLFLFTPEVHAMPTAQSNAITQARMAQFMNDFFNEKMAELQVPGAAVVVVQGDEILYQQGYGMADVAAQIPVDVEQTLFRTGSVSKLFTATAVMQLAEQGQIDLHEDVNVYLTDLELEPINGRPITTADLLTHTAGFDEVYLGMHSHETVETLTSFLQRHLPNRYNPPGEFISYNDHGYTLLGLLIEEVSDQPFDRYMAENVLQPLGMTASSFSQPLPAALTNRLAIGYNHDGQNHVPYPMDFVHVAPAAALVAPASEMAPFMIAHLNDGVYNGRQLLAPQTVSEMQQRQFAHHPTLRGRAYGFSEWLENGQRAIFHDGGNPGFMSRMFLLPEHNIGFYVSINGDQYSPAVSFSRELTSAFLDAFFPEVGSVERPPATGQPLDPAAYTGYYRDMQGYSHDTLQKLASLPNQFTVTGDQATLAVFGDRWVPVGDNLFGRQNGTDTLAFRTNEHGEATHLFVGTGAYVRLAWYESQPFHLGLVGWCVLMFLAAVVVGAFGGRLSSTMRLGLIAIGVLNIIFLAGMGIALMQMDPWTFLFDMPLGIIALLCLPLLTIGLTLLVGYGWTAAWHTNTLSLWGHSYIALLLATMVAYLWFLNFWNLLGFRFGG